MDKFEKEQLDDVTRCKDILKKALLIAQPYVLESLKNQVRSSRIATVTKDLQKVQDALMCDYKYVAALVVPFPCPKCAGKGVLAYCDFCGGTGRKPPTRADFRYIEVQDSVLCVDEPPKEEGFVENLKLEDTDENIRD